MVIVFKVVRVAKVVRVVRVVKMVRVVKVVREDTDKARTPISDCRLYTLLV